jgi:hypothetical protein
MNGWKMNGFRTDQPTTPDLFACREFGEGRISGWQNQSRSEERKTMRDVVIVSATRTPIGDSGGSLNDVSSPSRTCNPLPRRRYRFCDGDRKTVSFVIRNDAIFLIN